MSGDPGPRPPSQYWALSIDALIGRLATGPDGLTAVEAAERLRRHGPNILRPQSRYSALRLFWRQIASPLIWVLVIAAVIAGLVGDWTNATIVLTIILGSALLGFLQENRASRAVEELRARVRVTTTVLRDGRPASIPAEEVVPGDVVVLSAGSLIPADGVLLETKDCFVAEAALTGEPLPVEKEVGVTLPGVGVHDRTNCVFMGTSVRSGTARALIVVTGQTTAFGMVARRLRTSPPETEFERGIRRYGYLLSESMLVLTFVIFAANVLLHRPPIDALLFSIALAVGLSPELLPAIVTVTLSRGARAMARRGVIVRRLNAVENFGSMDVLCSDKTGTLTEGSMVLDAVRDPQGRPSDGLLATAYFNAKLQTGMGNALDDAIVAKAEAGGARIANAEKIDEIPYDFARKRLSVVVRIGDRGGELTMIAKGALVNVLDVCNQVRAGSEAVPLDSRVREAIDSSFKAWSGDGFRVLGVATRPVDAKAAYGKADEADLVFEGFLMFSDPPKEGIRETLEALTARGVTLKVITGDNRLVALHLARTVGLQQRLLSGEDIARLGQEALARAAAAADLFVEVDPGQKERIILALKQAGHVVGFLGDGINDAPALHVADVGISVDKAVDVAKEAADFVLLEHDLAVLAQGIEEGRAAFANTLKYISITTSANFGNMVSMAVASLFLPFLPMLARQILLNNFLSDAPAIAISGDNVDEELIRGPRRWDIKAIRSFMITFGLVSSVFDFLTFGLLVFVFATPPDLFRTAWFVESLMTELAITLVIRTYRPFYRSRPSRLLLVSSLAMMALTLILPEVAAGPAFGFVPLPWHLLVAVLAIVALYLAATEAVKRIIYRRA